MSTSARYSFHINSVLGHLNKAHKTPTKAQQQEIRPAIAQHLAPNYVPGPVRNPSLIQAPGPARIANPAPELVRIVIPVQQPVQVINPVQQSARTSIPPPRPVRTSARPSLPTQINIPPLRPVRTSIPPPHSARTNIPPVRSQNPIPRPLGQRDIDTGRTSLNRAVAVEASRRAGNGNSRANDTVNLGGEDQTQVRHFRRSVGHGLALANPAQVRPTAAIARPARAPWR